MKTPEEIKKGLENTAYYWEMRNGACAGYKLLKDALALIQQLEDEREDALKLIGRLIVILKKYPNAATNGCAYAAHEEIKKWLLHIKNPLPEPPKGE